MWNRVCALTHEQLVSGPGSPRAVRIAKRGLDILFAGLLLVLSAPVWLLLTLAIRLDSPGPALFRQLRVGRTLPDRTELFYILKFRSMCVHAEAGTGPRLAQAGDKRVTRVGRLLRRSRLDELPQLINVLRGEMSLIGPRPERPGIIGGLIRELPLFAERTRVARPGITGLAQVSQGYDTCLDDVRRKLEFDFAYADRLCRFADWLFADAEIAARTVLVMAQRSGY